MKNYLHNSTKLKASKESVPVVVVVLGRCRLGGRHTFEKQTGSEFVSKNWLMVLEQETGDRQRF